MHSDSMTKIVYGLLIGVVLMGLFNSYGLSMVGASGMGSMQGAIVAPQAAQPAQTQTSAAAAVKGPDVIPKGIPEIYGKELGVSYDDVSAADQAKAEVTIKKLGVLDQKLKLSGAGKERYISIASQISCEYCCGVESIIFKNGEAACGCAHSFAMRGLAKYLILNHANEYTDDQILEELGKWKTLFFPAQITQKAAVLQSKGIELNYINLASNKYRGAEKEAGSSAGSMVGGC
ncbi:hypothetical protein HYU10_04985 [Candidatus Woesearchaeota archaeon]|nr:hypothetical protein [Candidatus Woesearchaeota archaeon]